MKFLKLVACLFVYFIVWGINTVGSAQPAFEVNLTPIQQEVISTTHIIPLIQFDGRVMRAEDLMSIIRPNAQ